MNFSNNFSELWNSRFSGTHNCPQLDCLKADHFCSLLEQKQALEFEESKRCAIIDELKQQLNHETFVVEFLHKCIQKLSAISQVFNEIDQSDSKSSSSSGTSSRRPPSSGSPPTSINGSSSHNNKFLPSNSSFSLFPHCIASSLIHSASPLLAAAAVAPSSSFLLPSGLPQFPGTDTIKLDPDQDSNTGRASNFLLSAATDRSSSYEALSRLTGSTSIYPGGTNRFGTNSNFGAHSLRPPGASFETRGAPSDDGPFSTDYSNLTPSSEAQAAAAAAAVAAAFGLGFPPGIPTRTTPASRLSAFQTSDSSSLMNDSFRGPVSLHPSPPSGMNGKETPADSSVERPYQCSTCSRSFAVKAGLVQHMRTHTDERPYPCLHCGRAFKQKIQLTTHMRVHSGERPYGCRLCGKLFRQQSHVVQHLRTHTGEKPHKCYQCGKAFRQKYSLISHQRRMCRNRAASNPIAAGMTMWISPGVGGDTCNLVKEFSPARSTVTTAVPSLPSPNRSAASTPPVSVTNSAHSPFSPYLATSPGNCLPGCQTTGRFQGLSNHLDEARFSTAPNPPAGIVSSSSAMHAMSRAGTYRRKPVGRESPPKQANECATHLQSDNEEEEEEDDAEDYEEEEEEEDDDDTMQSNVCPSRSNRLTTPQNTTALGLT